MDTTGHASATIVAGSDAYTWDKVRSEDLDASDGGSQRGQECSVEKV